MTRSPLDNGHETVTVRLPMRLSNRRGRKLVIAPDTTKSPQLPTRVDEALVKALARARHWQRLLEAGTFTSITELAASEKTDRSYVCKTLRLNTLAPTLVEAVLNGTEPPGASLERLLSPFPDEWRLHVPDTAARDRASCWSANGPKADFSSDTTRHVYGFASRQTSRAPAPCPSR